MKKGVGFVSGIGRLRSRLFFKMFLIYAVIVISVISLLVGFILREVSDSMLQQAVGNHTQILDALTSYFEKQNANFKHLQRSLYLQKWTEGRSLASMTEDAFARPVGERSIAAAREIGDFLYAYSLSIDSDIHNLFYMDASSIEFVNVSLSGGFNSRDIVKRAREGISADTAEGINARKTRYLPAFPLRNGESAYCIHDYLRDPTDAGRVIGSMVAAYSPALIRNAYRSFEGSLLGDLYVLTDEKEVIFASTTDADFSYGDVVDGSAARYEDDTAVVLVERQKAYGFVTVAVISKGSVERTALPLVRMIWMGTCLSMLLILALTYLSMGSLRKRVFQIRGVLARIQNGEFGAKATILRSGDEIDEIASDVNQMGARLEETIQKQYTAQLNRANAELNQRTAQLHALQSQIDPHFLFNTLEGIRMRAVGEGDMVTGEMIKLLARSFRRRISQQIVASLNEELNNCREYLELYDMRFEGRLQVRMEAADNVLECGIPCHLLQPLVENAVVHGIDLSREDNEIEIFAGRQDGMLAISVHDNGMGIDAEKLKEIQRGLEENLEDRGESIGLLNVKARLRLLYGDNCALTLTSAVGGGTQVFLAIPVESKEALSRRVSPDDCG